ncbi:TPA: DUF551 domain-containing protein [Escherichia coli]|nr:DUF551 domain-containing protein [Escherichia coli]HBA8849872.1 DUF551 domain-containing protein [Escherichia coli]
MTTMNREEQKQVLIDTANHIINRDNTSPYSENLRELARIALASLEAEPIAWECGENIILFNPDTVEAYAKRAEISPKPLYAASPVSVTPDGWISCSERMPDSKTAVLVAREFDRKGDWRMKWATYIPGHPDANDGWIIPGASWKPSHWMPLPEPPRLKEL